MKAIAPIVIDTLNMPVQMKNQVNAFGKPSEMIKDYTERKLVPIPDTTEARKLWQMIDPWVYREKLTLPKMIINGTNDPYWPLDALNSYWDDLKGEKWVLYVPNAGHDLRESDANGKKETHPRAGGQHPGRVRAQPDLRQADAGPDVGVQREGGDLPAGGEVARRRSVLRIWKAESTTRDFRKARWVEDKSAASPAVVTAPENGFRAFYAETEYEMDGQKFTLCTQIRILEAKK